MESTVDTKRIVIFLAFAFGIAWLLALVLFLNGGLVNSPVIIPSLRITLATVVLAAGYMWAPALAHIFTRLVTREGWRNTGLRPNIKRGWPYWLAAWFLPSVLTLVGGFVFFALFPQYFDPQMTIIQRQLESTGVAVPGSLWIFVAVQMLSGVLIAPFINSLFTFGEEFGWRGYLLQKLMPLGTQRAMILMGIIWGVWHWPVIAMGHNYGLEYTGYPWLGMLAMVWFTFVSGTFLAWATIRGGSVWPAVIGHAAINGFAAAMVLFVQGSPNPLLGPTPVGIVGSVGWALFAVWLLLRPRWEKRPAEEQPGQQYEPAA